MRFRRLLLVWFSVSSVSLAAQHAPQAQSAFDLPTLAIPHPTNEGLHTLVAGTGVMPCDRVTRDYELPSPYGIPVYITEVEHWSGQNLDMWIDVQSSAWIVRPSGLTWVKGVGHVPFDIVSVSNAIWHRYANADGDDDTLRREIKPYVVLNPGDKLIFRFGCSPVGGTPTRAYEQHHEIRVKFVGLKPDAR